MWAGLCVCEHVLLILVQQAVLLEGPWNYRLRTGLMQWLTAAFCLRWLGARGPKKTDMMEISTSWLQFLLRGDYDTWWSADIIGHTVWPAHAFFLLYSNLRSHKYCNMVNSVETRVVRKQLGIRIWRTSAITLCFQWINGAHGWMWKSQLCPNATKSTYRQACNYPWPGTLPCLLMCTTH